MNSKRIENKGEYVMRNMPHFHGSDLEEIEKYYGIPKESIVGFGANVNPLGISETVRAEVTDHLDVIMTYPDRNYTSLKKVIGNYNAKESLKYYEKNRCPLASARGFLYLGIAQKRR